MNDDILFIPPCCVDQKLPRAVMQAPHRALTFFTHGDVTMEKLYRAVSYLIDAPHVMVLTMPVVSAETVMFLQQCFERKWITSLVLSTNLDAKERIERSLAGYADRILYARADNVTELSSHLVLYSPERSLVINGPMYEQPSFTRLVSYSMVFYPIHSLISQQQDWGNPLRNVLFPDVMRMRRKVSAKLRMALRGALARFVNFEFPPYDGEE